MASLKQITSLLNKLYPLHHADHAWDNVGLLVPTERIIKKILLTVDLTQDVCDEAIKGNADLIIAYHPFLFKKFNRINPNDTQHQSLMKLMKQDVGVYCPHTSVDAAKNGVNDWLVSGLALKKDILKVDVIEPVQPKGDETEKDVEGVGMGRYVEFNQSIPLEEMLERIKKSLNLQMVQYACLKDTFKDKQIKSVAICAGSGGGVFSALHKQGKKADLYYTGELSHHEGLALKEQGKVVVICGHSNTERGWLKWLQNKLIATENVQIVLSQSDEDVYQPFI
ncbi:hypothetical protein DAMA08_014400 [Martiniozyma asiatica (nom. inval.)]|nr:hypothetical protein DAMA08_014400 [Martiniozyma asiatica]